MTRSVKIRLIAFLVIAVAGVSKVSVQYLGLGDFLFDQGFTVTAELPGSGGLYTGGEVTVRGVAVGEIGDMNPTADGIRVDLHLEEGTRIPVASPFAVHNGSAVGEQYLDFSPASEAGPYLTDGDEIVAGQEALPLEESALLLELNRFVTSVDTRSLRSVVNELGAMFEGTGRPLQEMLDGTNRILDEATAYQDETIDLIENSETVLRTQQAHGTDIRRFAQGFRRISAALRSSDDSVRAVLQGGPQTFHQIERLLDDLSPAFPILMSNLITTNEVIAVRLPALEQLLVTFPVMVYGAFSGTTADGFGYVGQQFTDTPAPCQAGYVPLDQWRPASDATDPKDMSLYWQSHCASGPEINARGTKWAPTYGEGTARVAPYDPRSGIVADPTAQVEIGDPTTGYAFGKDAWKWMLLGPMTSH